jgi:predicted RNase H-like HicB family nuclease
MKHYIALIRKEKGSCYGVDFPDFPGCVTAADTVEEAQAQAVEILDLHVEGMVEDGEILPEATGLDQILEDPAQCEGLVLAVQVPLADKKSKKKRIDITVPEDVLRQADRFVKTTEGVNRSSFFSHAAMAHLQRTLAPPGFNPVMVRRHKKKVTKRTGSKRSKKK